MFDDIKKSFSSDFDALDQDDRTFLDALPADYRSFLELHNGGFAEEFRYTFLTGVPFKTEKVDNPSRDDCPVEFFGLPTSGRNDGDPEDLLQIKVDYDAEEFLPVNVIAIARCVQNSLVCLSLREDTFGEVFYWDWYWRYPWCKWFFDQRTQAVVDGYPDVSKILNDPSHALNQKVTDDLNFATLVRLASSFSEWGRQCTDRREKED